MEFYNRPSLELLKPVENSIGVECRVNFLRNNPFRRIRSLYNQFNNDCYLYHEEHMRLNPFKKVVDRIDCIVGGNFHELYFERSWISGDAFGPLSAVLRNQNGQVLAKTERIKKVKGLLTEEHILVPNIQKIETSQGVFSILVREHRNSIGFLECPAFPKREVELLTPQNKPCIWAGARKPQGIVRILEISTNFQILLSLFFILYIEISRSFPIGTVVHCPRP